MVSASIRRPASADPGPIAEGLGEVGDGEQALAGVLDESALAGTIAELAGEALRCDGFDTYADFFEAGAHSITALRLITRLRGKTGVEVPFRWIFQERTPVALARRILFEQPNTEG